METYIMIGMGIGSMILSYFYIKQGKMLNFIMKQYEATFAKLMQYEFSSKLKERKAELEKTIQDSENRGE